MMKGLKVVSFQVSVSKAVFFLVPQMKEDWLVEQTTLIRKYTGQLQK